MAEEETIMVNGTMRSIRKLMAELKHFSTTSERADGRHVAMVLTKLEEAELLAQRIIKERE